MAASRQQLTSSLFQFTMFNSQHRGPVRLLLAIPAMALGGTERVYLTLMKHLDRARVEPHLAVVEPIGLFLPSVPPDVPIHDLRVKHARNAVWPLVRLCRKIKPEVILSSSAHLNAAVIAARGLMPAHTVVMTREGADITAPEQRVSNLRLQIYRHIYRRADVVICQSQYMKGTLARDFALPPSRLVCVYNPVDVDHIRHAAHCCRTPYPTAGPNLVYAGRLSWEKGVDLLLRTMTHVRDTIQGATLTVLGEGPDTGRLFYLRRELKLESCVRFMGQVRNPYPFLHYAACVVLPSRTEALPNVVLEAVALGVPVVTTNCSGALEEIGATTRLMTICRDRAPECLAEAIVHCIRQYSGEARAIEPAFVACFGVEAIVRQYERIVLSSAGRKPLLTGDVLSVEPEVVSLPEPESSFQNATVPN